MNLYKKVCLICTLAWFATVSYAEVSVRGYTKKDGTYVQPHTRHDASKTKDEKEPAKVSDKSNKVKELKKEKEHRETTEQKKGKTEGDVSVKGYDRKDGTHVEPYHRANPSHRSDEKVTKEKEDNSNKAKEIKKESTPKSNAQKEGDVFVKGYTKKDGTYVQPYHRSSPTSSTEDKKATRATETSNSVNKEVTKESARKNSASQKEGDVSVKGYYRKDGTYVKPYHRSSPNKTDKDNWSTKGNVNPYTGKEGTKSPSNN